jgi:lipopolysaccharide/colanic/teichoic acid biosynthesis glycosyltransferase
LYHAASRRQKLWETALRISEKPRELHVIIVGINRLTETYIQALAQFGIGNISVAGLLGSTGKHVGRLLATYPVLGSPEDIESILDGLEVHGINVGRIVVAAPLRELRLEAQDALLRAERSRSITLQFLSEALGLSGGDEGNFNGRKQGSSASLTFPRFDLSSPQLRTVSLRSFWKVKRGLDAITAFALLFLLLPVFFLVFLAVAADTGFPVIFWQRRPGLGGRSFHLYKFRTMRAPRASDGSRIQDADRTSRCGNFLRRTRLDELPQLLNIIRGDMSFVGPRPLLPRDQPKDFLARLMVRPGLTGWAQVAGGRDISAEDKAALDLWYVYNASIRLDLIIAIKTFRIVVFGERICEDSMELAWRELTSCGIVKFQ